MPGTFDKEGEFERGAALLDDAIETLTMALGWRFDEKESALILGRLKQIQSAVIQGDIEALAEPVSSSQYRCP